MSQSRSNSNRLVTSIMQSTEYVNLKLISQCIFGVTLVLFLAELLRPGLLIDHRLWQRTPVGSVITVKNLDRINLDDSPSVYAKKILFWTQYFSEDFSPTCAQRQEAQAELDSCSVKNCIFSCDKGDFLESNAVIFHIRDMFNITLPAYRLPSQYFVFYLLESPLHTGISLDGFEEFFNLTFTYRLDSDVPSDYYHKQFSAPAVWRTGKEFADLWEQKGNFATIFMSYCKGPSFRNTYLEELAKFIPQLDVFGKCGSKTCNQTDKVYCDGLVTTYKFYLAFENSVCKDYITEKVYRALNHGTIPVVYGGANYSAFLPPGSYINILDYPDARSLAAYLLYLADNPAEYAKYFQWRFKPKYSVLPKSRQPENMSWCRLCKLLHLKDRTQRIVKKLAHWWHDSAHCSFPRIGVDAKNAWTWIKNPVVNYT